MATLKEQYEEYLAQFEGKRVAVNDYSTNKDFTVLVPPYGDMVKSSDIRNGNYNNGYQAEIRVGSYGGDCEDEWRSDKTNSRYININNFAFAKAI